MIKIIDMDELFDNYISDFVYKNIGKIKAEEIENKIPELYEKFGNTKLEQLNGETPNEYYKTFSGKELVDSLKRHINENVSVSDFLCEAIQNNPENEKVLLDALEEDSNEEFILYLMNMLEALNSTACSKKYLNFVLWDYSEPIKELATELLCNMPNLVAEDIVKEFNRCSDNVKAYLTQILSYADKNDAIFEILISEFNANKNNLPLYAGYLAKYGDERALPYLTNAIESDKINYFDFEELRFAIESLGGVYDKKRDFSSDKIFQKIKEENKKHKV